MRITAIVACLATLTFIIVGAIFHWTWAGFDKPLYDWMQLLIIPVALTLIALRFNRIDKRNEQMIASDNQQEAALQGYLDRMSELLLEKQLRTLELGVKMHEEVRNVARVRTLTMFYQLNTRRTNYILSFLRESGLVSADTKQSIITFNKANFQNTNLARIALYDLDLSETNFVGAYLYETNFRRANLNEANLDKANLSWSDLREANLSRAKLSHAYLYGASLSGANLSGAFLLEADLRNVNFGSITTSSTYFSNEQLNGANLSRAMLIQANLRNANLAGTDLRGAYFSGANLRDANLKDADLRGAELGTSFGLKGANLSGADLRGAMIDKTSLDKATLTKEQIAAMQVTSI